MNDVGPNGTYRTSGFDLRTRAAVEAGNAPINKHTGFSGNLLEI
jgi:hypothetical protein